MEDRLARLETVQAIQAIELLFEDSLGVMFGDFFDLDATFGRHDQHRTTRFAVDDDTEIEFSGDIEAPLDVDRVDLFAFGAGLDGDQRIAEHPSGIFFGFFGRANEDDAALLRCFLKCSLATATCVNL